MHTQTHHTYTRAHIYHIPHTDVTHTRHIFTHARTHAHVHTQHTHKQTDIIHIHYVRTHTYVQRWGHHFKKVTSYWLHSSNVTSYSVTILLLVTMFLKFFSSNWIPYGGKLWQRKNLANSLQLHEHIGERKFGKLWNSPSEENLVNCEILQVKISWKA